MARSTAHLYDKVPAALPPVLPAMTRLEAQRIATKIVRKFWPRAYKRQFGKGYTYTSVRNCWLSPVATKASNHDKGLGRLIHDMSHDVFNAVYPHKQPHDPLHARYETDIAAFVAASGWLKRVSLPPVPKARPTLEHRRAVELRRVEASIKRWESKARRAANALKKLRAKHRRLSRAMCGTVHTEG